MRYLLYFCLILSWVGPALAQEGFEAKRVVSLGPINTENVYLLGAQDRLVANSNYCVRPEAARDKEKIGSVMQVNIEKIVSLQPDLILATGLTQPQQISKLRSLGFKVVRFRQPSSFAAICDQFLELGRLLGMEAEAARIVDEARARVKRVEKLVADLPPQKVFLQIGSQPLFAAAPGSFTHDYIAFGGGINIAADQKRGGVKFEQVIAENPAVIIVAIMGSESGIGAQQKQRWLAASVIDAARDNRVHLVSPDTLCSPSPATFASTLEVVARHIHPELAEMKNMEEVP